MRALVKMPRDILSCCNCKSQKIYIMNMYIGGTAMATMTTNTTPSTSPIIERLRDEPWGIWAGIVFVLATVVTSVLTFGVPGLVAVAVPGAFFMLFMLLMIVRGK
jgi:hypothetical protein